MLGFAIKHFLCSASQESKNDHTRAWNESNQLRNRCFHYIPTFGGVQSVRICDA